MAFGNIPLPSVPPINIPNVGNIPLPGMFTSITPSTYNIAFPMPVPPPAPSTAGFSYPTPFLTGEVPSIPAEPMMEPEGASSSPLQKFIAEVRDTDFSLVAKYRVDFVLPPAIFDMHPATDLSQEEFASMSLFCDEAVLPGLQLDIQPFRVYGPSFARPVHVSYGDTATFSIMLKQDLRPRRIFEAWMNMISDPISYNFNYPNKYLSSGIVVNVVKHRGSDLGGEDKAAYSVRLIDAFPTAIAASPLNFGSREIQRIQVTFSYRKWTSAYDGEIPPQTFMDAKDYVDPSEGGTGGDNTSAGGDPLDPPTSGESEGEF